MDWNIAALKNKKIPISGFFALVIIGALAAALFRNAPWDFLSKIGKDVSNPFVPQPAYGDIQIRTGNPQNEQDREDFFSGTFDDFFNMHRDFEQMLRGRFFNDSPLDSEFVSLSNQARIRDEGESYTVSVDLPGADKASIDLRVDGDLLKLSSERTEKIEEKTSQFSRQANTFGRTSRTIKLPSPVRKEGATAKYDNGVLTISVQKDRAAENAGDRIEIQ